MMDQGAPNIDITDELLSKYFAGEALPAEAMAIDEWRKTHAGDFDASWNAWNATNPRPYTLPDPTIVWQAIAAGTKRKIRLVPWLAAATLLSAIVWFLLQKKPVQDMTIAATQTTITQSLPDGSVAKVAPGGQLSYTDRTIVLKGNGDFDVKFDPDKPFVVKTGPVIITVLGTSFHVTENDSLVMVQVTTGKVKMEEAGKSIVITAGQMGYYHKTRDRLFLETYHFAFDDATLDEITTRLAIAFQKKITIKDPALAQLRTSSIFDNKQLDYILEVIASTLNLKYTYLHPDEIYIEAEE
jgi:ferric-dicitrate binding protein FerR (iron transport regulator)